MGKRVLFLSNLVLSFICIVFSYDSSPLQDFCVADWTSKVIINGVACKDPATVQANDFFFSGLHLPGNTSNPFGAALTIASVATVPGLNTLGLTLARLDFAPNGYNPPHVHPRASETITVLEGSLEVGFVTSYPEYKHYGKVLQKGDFFVIPVGLLHYQRQVGTVKAVALSMVNSQNPGIDVVTNGVFGAKPPINSDYLSRAFSLDKKIVEQLQSKF